MPGLQIQPHDGSTTQWVFSFWPLHPSRILSTDSHPSTDRDCRSPHLVGFSFLTTNHTNLNGSTRGGVLSDHPHGQNHSYSQSTDRGVESSKTYLRVWICVYSPRTGIRSKCLQNPWGVTLTMEPNHLRRLQDAVGFSFLPRPTDNYLRVPLQWVFSFLPRPTNKYLRVLHTRV